MSEKQIKEKAKRHLRYVDTLIATMDEIINDDELLEKYYKECEIRKINDPNPHQVMLFLIGMSNGIRLVINLDSHYLTNKIPNVSKLGDYKKV